MKIIKQNAKQIKIVMSRSMRIFNCMALAGMLSLTNCGFDLASLQKDLTEVLVANCLLVNADQPADAESAEVESEGFCPPEPEIEISAFKFTVTSDTESPYDPPSEGETPQLFENESLQLAVIPGMEIPAAGLTVSVFSTDEGITLDSEELSFASDSVGELVTLHFPDNNKFADNRVANIRLEADINSDGKTESFDFEITLVDNDLVELQLTEDEPVTDDAKGYFKPQMYSYAGNSKLFVVAHKDDGDPMLLICEKDGADCETIDLSLMLGLSTGGYAPQPMILKDTLYMVAADEDNKLWLFTCDLSGSGCERAEFFDATPVGISTVYTNHQALVMNNGVTDKLAIAATDTADENKLDLLICNMDGTGCVESDVSGTVVPALGDVSQSGHTPDMLFDEILDEFLFATRSVSNSNNPVFYRCDKAIANCEAIEFQVEVDGMALQSTGFNPQLLVDATMGSGREKFIIVAEDESNAHRLGRYTCDLQATDDSTCAHTDISAGQDGNSGYAPEAVIDAVNGSLIVTTLDADNRLQLVRCPLSDTTGESCEHVQLSTDSFADQNLILDFEGQLLLSARNETGNLSLFRFSADVQF